MNFSGQNSHRQGSDNSDQFNQESSAHQHYDDSVGTSRYHLNSPYSSSSINSSNPDNFNMQMNHPFGNINSQVPPYPDMNQLQNEISRLRDAQKNLILEQQQFQSQTVADITHINSRIDMLMGSSQTNPSFGSPQMNTNFQGQQDHTVASSGSDLSPYSYSANTPRNEPSYTDVYLDDNRSSLNGLSESSAMPHFHMDRTINTVSGLIKEWFYPNAEYGNQCVNSMERQFKTRWRSKAGDKKFFLSRKRIIDFVLQEVRRTGGGDGSIYNHEIVDKIVEEIEQFRVNPQNGSKISLERLSKIIKENRGSLPGVGPSFN